MPMTQSQDKTHAGELAPRPRSSRRTLPNMRTRLAIGVAMLLAVGLIVSCDSGSGAPPQTNTKVVASAKPIAAGPPRPVNVVMMTIDTLRAGRLGAYGCEKPTSPNIDALAGESVLFEQAVAPASWTLASVPSIFTSTFPCEHGLIEDRVRLNDGFETIAQRFKRAGYQTASYFSNPYLGAVTGLNRGFDTTQFRKGAFTDGTHISQWLGEKPDGLFFLYIHNMAPHDAWRAPRRLIEQFGDVSPATVRLIQGIYFKYKPLLRVDWKAGEPLGTTNNTRRQRRFLQAFDQVRDDYKVLYDAAVRLADERVGSVVQSLKDGGQWDDTLFILLSDHGEEFGEHGAYIHGQSLYQELIHVPLIVHFPSDEHAGTRVPSVVSLIDVLPTIFSYLNRPQLAEGARGRDLMPLIEGAPPADESQPRVVACRINVKKYYKPWAETRGNVNVALRMGKWKGIWNRDLETFELYNVERDPFDQNNLCGQHPDLVESMARRARDWYRACGVAARDAADAEASPEYLKDLADLGYLDSDDDEPHSPAGSLPAGPRASRSEASSACPVKP